ncbi:hypothetical protein IQ268_30645 [Oculatella sp. LEGE 06141]|uniref:hypothetical protein n=1 Tax=Oculatella sp. LEGE 06141 TaxID=1828648 RepID=UPI00188163DC|nr:hypothetical protein [Oculatella sp. LEGE 06141]MBE9182898.1 hypothetical protein [Oculatella sp. LEGE 06141]
MQLQRMVFKKFLPLSLFLVLSPLAACRVEREEVGSLPEVDVSVEPGNFPEYDIQGPDVNVGVAERTVTVPRVVVVQEQETVEVPYIDVDVPGAEREERTVTTEVEVPSSGYDLSIEGIYAVNNELWVVSRLEETDPNAPQADVRVSDRVVLNAPDVPIRQYVIGARPDSSFNEQYTFIDDREQIVSQLDSGRQLYEQANS